MTRILLDTNVLSELVRARPDPKVVEFVDAQSEPFISAVTIHEITYGAERTPDPARRVRLVSWVAQIRSTFAGRIVDVDADVAEQAGRLRAAAAAQGVSTDSMDALIAACAVARAASVATRNVRDFSAYGVTIIDPWNA